MPEVGRSPSESLKENFLPFRLPEIILKVFVLIVFLICLNTRSYYILNIFDLQPLFNEVESLPLINLTRFLDVQINSIGKLCSIERLVI